MLVSSDAPTRARWAVMWVASKNGRSKVIRKDFKDDFASAMKLYLKARDAGKRAATLACVNIGFAPPEHLRPHIVRKKGRDKRTRRIRVIEVTVQPLRELNLAGKLWCPYCREIRPFILRKAYMVGRIRNHDPCYVCPICGISQRDHHVRLWNPTAVSHMESSLAARPRSSRSASRRRRR